MMMVDYEKQSPEKKKKKKKNDGGVGVVGATTTTTEKQSVDEKQTRTKKTIIDDGDDATNTITTTTRRSLYGLVQKRLQNLAAKQETTKFSDAKSRKYAQHNLWKAELVRLKQATVTNATTATIATIATTNSVVENIKTTWDIQRYLSDETLKTKNC